MSANTHTETTPPALITGETNNNSKFTQLRSAIREQKIETVRELVKSYFSIEEILEHQGGRFEGGIIIEEIFRFDESKPRFEQWRWIQDVLLFLTEEFNFEMNILPFTVIRNILYFVITRHAHSVLEDLHTLGRLTPERAIRAGIISLLLLYTSSAQMLHVACNVYNICGIGNSESRNLNLSPDEQEDYRIYYLRAHNTAVLTGNLRLAEELESFYYDL